MLCFTYMKWTPGSGKLRFALSLFLVYLILIVFLGLYSMNNHQTLKPEFTSQLILFMGVLLAMSASFFTWAMEARRNYLEQEIRRKTQDVLIKNSETKKAEVAAAAIYQCARILFSQTKFEGLLENVMDLVGKVIYADEGSLMLFDSKHELYIAASRGLPEMVARGVHIKVGQKVAGLVAQERRDYLLVDGLDKYPEFAGIESNGRIRSSIVCPLVCQQELLGVLSLNRTVTQENFTIADMIHVSIFASQVAQALRNAYLYQALENKVAELEEVNGRLKNLQNQLQHLNLENRKAA